MSNINEQKYNEKNCLRLFSVKGNCYPVHTIRKIIATHNYVTIYFQDGQKVRFKDIDLEHLNNR